jgi:predicted PurR-regulated permease PerM
LSGHRTHWRFWLIGLALFLFAIYLLRGILLPFVAGMGIAYLLDPICDWLERRGSSRALATCLITACACLVLAVVGVLLAPLLQQQVITLLQRSPTYVEALRSRVDPLVTVVQANFKVDLSQLRDQMGAQAGNILGWVATALADLLSSGLALANILSLVFITPVVAFYLLRDWDRLMRLIDSWLPRRHAETIREQLRMIDHNLSGFVHGQALVCVVLAVYYAVGLSLFRLDFGLALGLFIGAIAFVPFVGSSVGFASSIGLAFIQYSDWWPILGVAGLFVVGQTLEGYVLTPKLVGDRVGLHPVWVIFALLAGGALFGFLGVLLAMPAAAVIGVLTRFALGRYLASPLFDEANPGSRQGGPPDPMS